MTAFPLRGPWCRLFASHVKQISASLLALLLTLSVVDGQGTATVGEWSPVMIWPYKAVHAQLLPTGKVMWWPSFQNGDNPTLWNPSTNTNVAAAQAGANIFCSGHSFLADGTLLVAGGHINNWVGLPTCYIYSPFNGTWMRAPDMNNFAGTLPTPHFPMEMCSWSAGGSTPARELMLSLRFGTQLRRLGAT
jgi:Kelch motif